MQVTNGHKEYKLANCYEYALREISNGGLLRVYPGCLTCDDGYYDTYESFEGFVEGSGWPTTEGQCLACDSIATSGGSNWNGCLKCDPGSGSDATCLRCEAGMVLTEASPGAVPAHQCVFPTIENCDSQTGNECTDCRDGYWWNGRMCAPCNLGRC
jgi:hypothetical protein